MSIVSVLDSIEDVEEHKEEVPAAPIEALPEKHKVIFVGPPGSGKSSMIQAIMGKEFNPNIKSTDCYEYHVKKFHIAGKTMKIDLWDCSPEHSKSYAGVKKAFYRGTFCAFIVIDLCMWGQNIEQVKLWASECFNNEVYQVFVIGSKLDMMVVEAPAQQTPQATMRTQSIQMMESILTVDDRIKDQSQIQYVIRNIKKMGLQVILGNCKGENNLGAQFVDLLQEYFQRIRTESQQPSNVLFQSDKKLMNMFRQNTQQTQDEPDQVVMIQSVEAKNRCWIF